jgi:hypothetical protein
MPIRQLPDHPSLRHLRNEAKALRRATREGDSEALTLMRSHVRRLQKLDDEDAAAGVTLQEIQHALACDYGFSEWTALVDAAEPHLARIDLQDLMRLSERDAETLLRAVDRRDLLRVVMGADTVLADNIMSRLSPRVARQVRVEQELEPELSKGLIDASRERICTEARQLASQGAILWPGTEDGANADDGIPVTAPALDSEALLLLRRPVPDLTQDEIVTSLGALGEVVTHLGWNACEDIGQQATEFVGEGIRLIIDGVEPDLHRDVLETRMLPLLQRHRMSMALLVEALFCAICGDNPRVVAYKLEVLYKESMSTAEAMDLSPALIASAQTEQLRVILQRGPWRELSLDEMRDFFVRAAIISRREGIRGLAGLADAAQDRLLNLALRLLGDVRHADAGEQADGITPDEWLHQVETEMGHVIEDTYHRYQMIVEGLSALHHGIATSELEAVVCGVERKPHHEIRGGRI